MKRVLIGVILLLFLASCKDMESKATIPADNANSIPVTSTASSIFEEDKESSADSTNTVTGDQVSGINAKKTLPVKEESTSPVYYEYKGGKLPGDITTPIEYVTKSRISPSRPEFTYKVYGVKTQSYKLTSGKDKYYLDDGEVKMNKIIVICNELFLSQELAFSETSVPFISKNNYGFSLDDWNFDGMLDISLRKYEGPTSLNSPHYFWLWNSEKNKYVKNSELEDISEDTFMEIDKTNKQVVASTRLSDGYYTGYYQWQQSHIVLFKTDETHAVEAENEDGKYKMQHTISELFEGEMKVTKKYFED